MDSWRRCARFRECCVWGDSSCMRRAWRSIWPIPFAPSGGGFHGARYQRSRPSATRCFGRLDGASVARRPNVLQSLLGDASTLSPLLLCVAALVGAAVGSVIPISPTEPLLLGLAAVAPPSLLLPIAGFATLGHMTGKTVV